MFVGHYSVAFAVKRWDRRIPLWQLFIAVQLLDVLWGIFVLPGIEKVRIAPGITATLPLDLYYFPYTHSLVMAVLWSVVVAAAYSIMRATLGRSVRSGILVGVAVLSHWILDLPVHRPDLPLYDNRYKIGFGLWNYPVVALLVETALLCGGVALYLRSTKISPGRVLVLGALLLVVHVVALFGFTPPSPSAAALSFVSLNFLLAAGALWLERQKA